MGRATLLARLDQLLVKDHVDHWVVVTGGPGMGKSALLAAWLARREATGAVVPHHFIRRGEYDWDDPAKLVSSLVAQIEMRYPEQRDPEFDPRMHPAARLDMTLRRVSENELVPRSERLVVLIDGFDEYDPSTSAPAGDPLAAFLPHALPRGVSLLCASRPRHPYVSSLEARNGGLVRIDLDAPSNAADNDATVRCLWEQAAPILGMDAHFIEEAVTSAGGNVQHAVTLQKHLAGLPTTHRRVERIPRGLAALLERSWERLATSPVVVDGLGILCAAREALTLDEIGAVVGWTDNAHRRAFLRGAKELLVEAERTDGDTEYRLHHDSIRSYIAGELGSAALREYHAALARRLAIWPPLMDESARRYALRHALMHRTEAREWADAWRLAADMSFLEAKCRELGAHEAEFDMARAAERCRASGAEVLRRRFDDLVRALGRESHWLRTAPEATAALVWNQLRRSGWSPDEIDRQLQVPTDTAFLRLRHIATRESSALVRDLVGHPSDHVVACAVSSDGRRVVSSAFSTAPVNVAEHKVVRIPSALKAWDLDSGRLIAILEDIPFGGLKRRITPDGRRVVTTSDDNTLKVLELDSGRNHATLQGHSDTVSGYAVTPDGQRVISFSADCTIKVWDLDSGRNLSTLQGHSGAVVALAISSNGRRVIAALDDNTIKVWDLHSRHTLAKLRGHSGTVTALATTPDGRRVIWTTTDSELKVWDLDSVNTFATLQGHSDEVTALAVIPDGRRVVSASKDNSLRIWDLDSERTLVTLQGHSGVVTAIAVTPDGRRVVSGSEDSTLKVWDVDSGRTLATLLGHYFGITACEVTPDGRHVISATGNEIKVWAPDSERSAVTLEGHSAFVAQLTVVPNGRRVVSGSHDGTLKVWDLDSGRNLVTMQGHSYPCVVAPDGQRIVSASKSNTLDVWDLESGRTLITMQDHSYPCLVTPDGRHVVSTSKGNVLKIWELDSGRVLDTMQGHPYEVTALAIAPDGCHVVSASDDQTHTIWDLESASALAVRHGPATGYDPTNWDPDTLDACAVTPDGLRLILAMRDGLLKVLDLDSGHILVTLQDPGSVNEYAMTPDCRRVVSASWDTTLKVWDLQSGRKLATLQGHSDRVQACAVTPDGRYVVSASWDKTLKIWDLESYTCLVTHRANVGFTAVAANATTIIAGDAAGSVWFLDWPPSSGFPFQRTPQR